MELFRIIQIFVIQLFVGVIYFLTLAGIILYKHRKNLNRIFSLFFIFLSLGSITNIIYSLITVEQLEIIVLFLHVLAYFFFHFAFVFLLLFVLILLKTRMMITPKRQKIIFLGYIGLFLLLITSGLGLGGITINSSTNWKPKWSFPFFIVSILLEIPLLIAPILYYAFQIFSSMGHLSIRQRWKYFLTGIIIYSFMLVGTTIVNFLAIPSIRNVWGFIALILFLMAYTIYYGVGKKIK